MVDGTLLGLPAGSDGDTSADFLADDYQEGDEDIDPDVPVRTTIGDEDDEDEDDNPYLEEPPAAEEQAEETEEEESEEDAEEEPRLYAGRYPSQQAFEQGYKDIQAGFTRVVQENKTLVQQMEQERQEREQLKQFVLQMAMEQDPELAERLQAEEAFNAAVGQAVEQRVAPIQEQLQQQQQAEASRALLAEAEQTIKGFMADHQIVQGDEVDVAMRDALETLVGAGVPLSPANREHLDLLYDAMENRTLLFEIANARPEIFRVPGGTDFLRQRAGATITPAAGSPPQGTQPKPRGAVRRRVEAYVETGSGAPGASSAPEEKDPFDEAVEWYQNRFAKGPLFGSRR